MGCKRGYFMQGDGKINCNASGIWQPENLSCTSKYAKLFFVYVVKALCIEISHDLFIMAT